MTLERDVEAREDPVFKRDMKRRSEALHNGNDRVYTELTDKYRMTPEDSEAYERGRAEIELARTRQREYFEEHVQKPSVKTGQTAHVRPSLTDEFRPSTAPAMRNYIRDFAERNPNNEAVQDIARGVGRAKIIDLDLIRRINRIRIIEGKPVLHYRPTGRGYVLGATGITGLNGNGYN